MATIYISIGSNIDPRQHVAVALDELHDCFGNIQTSSMYESRAVGFDGDNFINLVAGAQTDKDIQAVVDCLHAIEDRHGRQRSGPKFSSRTLDLDLLLYDDVVYEQGRIKLPRDEILYNAFVLCPLAELAPRLVHPTQGKSIAQLWDTFDKDSQALWKID